VRLFRQMPAYSPLTLGAILSGARAAWLGGGAKARRQLDGMLREQYGPKELYLTDSGTSALTLALQSATAVTHAPVALPAYCCYDVGAGCEFFLYDINPGTLSPDLASLRRVLEGGARTVVVAHLYGVPVDLAAVQALAAEFGALVIEDAAQGSGCEWKGMPAGAHGDLGILSFGRGKGVTGGKGGALLVNNARLIDAASAAWQAASGPRALGGSLKELALLVAQWLFGRPSLYWIPAGMPFLGLGETIYKRPHPVGGISALAAGVLSRTMPLVPAEVAHRREVAAGLAAAVSGAEFYQPPEGWTAGWLRFPLLAPTAAFREAGAPGAMPGYPRALGDLAEFGGRRQNPDEPLSGARELAARLVTLPTHHFVRGG